MQNEIEQMAKITCLCNACGICECDKEPCDLDCSEGKAMERLYNAGYRKTADVAKEIDDLKRYIILNEDIALKCKEENGEQNHEYWKGKLSAFKQIRAYIDAELKKKYTEEQING